MKILRNFIMGLYANISMLKDVWEKFSKAKLAIIVTFCPANIRLDEDVLKTSCRRLSSSSSEDVFIKTFSRHTIKLICST